MTDDIESPEIRIDVHEEPAWRRVIDIEIPTDRVAAAYAQVFKDYQKKAKIPGFRPGKVPLSIVEKRFGNQAHQDVLERLVPHTLSQAYRDHRLLPITDPEFSNLQLKPGEPLKFRATVEVRPEVNPTDYTGLVLEKETRPVRDDDVDQTIERIREQRAEFVKADQRSARGDTVICDLKEITADVPEEKRRNLEGISILLDPERVFPEIADALTGLNAGESREFTMTYPAEYSDKELAGRTATYHATVKEVQVKKLPELTPEFLKSLAGHIETEDQLKAMVRADLETQVEDEARRALKNDAITKVLERNAFELPSSLVRGYLERLTEDLKQKQPEITPEQVEAQYKELGERQVRWEFLYHAIADKESIQVTDDDTDAWLERFAQNYGITREQARAELAGSQQVARVKDNILESKVLDFLLEKATVTELPTGAGLIQTPGSNPDTKKRG